MDDVSRDAVPLNAILLTDAYRAVESAIEERPGLIEQRLDSYWLETIEKNRKLDRQNNKDTAPEEIDLWHLDRAANMLLRQNLQEGKLRACVRDPETGDILRLIASGWIPDAWDKNTMLPAYGILTDFVRTVEPLAHRPYDDVPGPPGSLIRGKRRPVFFLRDEFDTWWEATFGAGQAKRRKSSGWEKADDPLVSRMRERIEAGMARSVEDAARHFAGEASGSGTVASKQTRLAKRYRQVFPE